MNPGLEGAFVADAIGAATRLGEQLCTTARWDSQSCCWERSIVAAGARAPMAPAGDLYAGSSGIALFLAELSRFVPRPKFIATALGALHHAVAWASETDPTMSLSAFSGPMGVAYALHYVAAALPQADVPSSCAMAERTLMRSRTAPPCLLEFMSGSAGAISVLLTLAERSRSSVLQEAALELGEHICACADWMVEQCTWDPLEASGFGKFALSGLSHGVSGLAQALLRLYALSGDEEFLLTARGAYAYEDSIFEPSIGRWLDLRFVETVEEARSSQAAVVAWCHGAGGIALSRLVASRLDPDWAEVHRQALHRAVRAVVQTLEEGLQIPGRDATPCHGLLGLADILATIQQLAPDFATGDSARQAAQVLLEKYREGNWPLSFLDDQGAISEAGLMTGRAGIGHSLLRLVSGERTANILLLL